MTSLRSAGRALMALIVGISLTIVVPSLEAAPPAEGASKAKTARRGARGPRAQRGRSRARRTRPRRARRRPMTARRIRRWQRKGWSDRRIMARIRRAGGYRINKKRYRLLKRLGVRKSLRRRLARIERRRRARARARAAGRPYIDLRAKLDPDDIDFDSVAPPEGMDMDYADLHKYEAEQKKSATRPRRRPRRTRARSQRSARQRTPIRPPGAGKGQPNRSDSERRVIVPK